jgi:antitoxin CptB
MEPSAIYSDPELKRLYWHSRRGMLELDLLLVPFASTCLAALTPEQIARYRTLLAEEDQDLFVWLTSRALAPTPELRDIVALVLAHNTPPA